MKIEVDIPIEEFDCYNEYEEIDDNSVKSFMQVVIDRVAEKLLAEICGSYKTDINKMLSDKMNYLKQTIENKILRELSDDSYAVIKNKISENVITEMTNRYERSHQYRDIKKQFEIENESTIKVGMKAIISDIVRAEVKKIIKL